jgi:tripeptide aminopeptidase
MNTDVALLLELLAIKGPPGQEKLITERVREILTEMGVPPTSIISDQAHKHSEHGGETGNMIVHFPGNAQGTHRVISSHLDTIPDCLGCRPRLQGERIVNDAPGTALGGDARAGLVIQLAAARALLATGNQHPPCTLVFFVQEEVGLLGSRHFDKSLLADPFPEMWFNFDEEEVALILTGAIGTERINFRIFGHAVHTCQILEGISAATIFAEAMQKLIAGNWVGHVVRDNSWANSNLGILEGGSGSNVTMPELYCRAECRSYDLELRNEVLSNWRRCFQEAVDSANQQAIQHNLSARASLEFTAGPEYPPYQLPDEHPAVKAAQSAVKKAGLTPRLGLDDGGMDTCNIVRMGIPAVGLGDGDRQAHSNLEWIDIPDFLAACRTAEFLAIEG